MKSILTFIQNWGQDFIHFKYRRRSVLLAYVAIPVLIFVVFIGGFSSAPAEEAIVQIPEVEVATVQSLASSKYFSAVGTVEAISEARLQTESGGRVTGVFTEIGKTVTAGTIIMTLESASENAALLQAEGAYEAALSSSASGDVGTREAEIKLSDAVIALQAASDSSFGTAQNMLFNTIDSFYADATGIYPTMRITVTDQGDFLRDERKAFQEYLITWNELQFTTTNANKNADFVIEKLDSILLITDALTEAVNHHSNDFRYTDVERSANLAKLATARAQIVAAKSSFTSALTNLKVAEESLERAQITSSGGTASLADAQLKQALGSLRAAQANYERTVVRTPITGVVNALYFKTGEYASPDAPAAIVANNSGLEVRTSVTQDDALKLVIGDAVTIDKTATGTISAIAGAIDPTTGKVAVNVALENTGKITNGTTVTITFGTEIERELTDLTIPLSAVKMTGSGPVVFAVNEQKQLTAIPVVLGAVSGSAVLIEEGITAETEIVVDARGLKAGAEVSISTK